MRTGRHHRESNQEIKTRQETEKQATHRSPLLDLRRKEVINDRVPSGTGQCTVTNNR